MEELKACPFCGKDAVMHTVYGISKYVKFKKEIPKGARIERSIGDENGKISFYEYRQLEFVPQCSDTTCVGRTIRRYSSEIEAIEAWNKRVENDE